MDTSITPTSVTFYKDEVTAFRANDGEIYTPANKVLRNIGFNEDRVKAIRKKWRDDHVISSNGRYFTLRYTGGIQPVDKETLCFSTKILPLALAKISITPELEKSYPEVVEKLVRYQLECADVLYKHFVQKSVSTRQDMQSRVDKPLTRDDMAKLMIYLNKLWMDYTAYNDGKIDKLLAAIEIQNEKCSQKQYTSLTFTSTPPKVCECIKAIAKKRGVTYTNAAHFAYREIERRTGCDLKKEAAAFAAKHGYKNCRKPYYVGNTERYFNVLKEIANE